MNGAAKAGPIEALIFDMDGTMIDSMGYHAQSWAVFARQHGLNIEIGELMRRTTGRTGAECMRHLFQRELSHDEAWTLIGQKEQIYRELFAPVFAEVAGCKAFYAQALARGLKVGVGSAGDRHNLAFAFKHLALPTPPHAVVGGDEGLPGKPEPAIFLKAANAMAASARGSIVFEDAPFGIEAARRAGMYAVAICSSHTPAQLAGPHVIATVRDYHELMNSNFLETLNVVTT
jgi:beta-phosphoglucomutase-like phosphatase (HAD superfamily)